MRAMDGATKYSKHEAICITCSKLYIKYKPQIKNCSYACSAKWRLGRKPTEETRKKLSQKQTGTLASNWKGGKPNCAACGKPCSRRGVTYCIECIKTKGLLKDLVPSGARHYKWTDGVYKKPPTYGNPIRRTRKYKTWREEIIKRDGKCWQCGSINRLEVDHIKPLALFPELAFDKQNARTLCHDCHKATPTFGGRMKTYVG